MFKNKFVVLSLVVLSFLAGILLFSFSPNIETFAQRVLRSNTLYENNWQYCAITRINVVNPPQDRLDEFVGAVTIDYFEYSKDRVTLKESYVRSECLFEKLNYAEFLQDNSLKHSPRAQQIASSKTADLALARAMNRLGANGWEMVGRNFANVNFETLDGNANYKNALFQKVRLAKTNQFSVLIFMNKNGLMFGIIGLLVGLIVGFLAANSINRNSQIAVAPTNQPTAPFQNQQVQTTVVKDQPTQSGMMPAVQETLDKAKAAPNDFDAQIKAGDLYARIKGVDRAVEFYERAHQIKPEDYETIVKIGNTYFDAGQFEQAQKWYEEALAKKPNDVNVRTDLGITFVERANPDLDRAIKEFQTSLQTDPKHEATLYNLGVAYAKKGNAEETNKIIAQLETVNPNSQLVQRLRQLANL